MRADLVSFREHLRTLDDAALVRVAATCKRDDRQNLPRGETSAATNCCWYECVERGREDLFLAALDEVRQQEREHRENNSRTLRQLRDYLDGRGPWPNGGATT